MRALRLALGLVGLALFAKVVADVPREAWAAPKNPWWSLGVIVLSLIMVALSAWRWQVLNRAHAHPLSFGAAFRHFLFSLSLGFVTPGRLGDLSRAWMGERRHENSTAVRLSLVVQERLIDVLVMAALSAFGLWQLRLWGHGAVAIAIVLGGLVAGLAALGISWRWLSRHPSQLAAFVGAFRELWRQPGVTLGVTALSLGIWALRILQLRWVALVVGEGLPLDLAAGILPLSMLAGLASFIPLGLGAQDLSMAALVGAAGFPAGFGNLLAALYRVLVNAPLLLLAAALYAAGKGPTSRTTSPSAKRRSR